MNATARVRAATKSLNRVGSSAWFGIYGGYEIAQSNGRGGKAGKGRNKTATIQVRESVRPGEYLLKAQFRYTVGNSQSQSNAHAKARAWIDSQHLTTKMPNAESSDLRD